MEHTMRVMHPLKGDETFTWKPDDAKSVAEAKQRFDDLLAAGHKAYTVAQDPKKGDEIKEFDPQLGKILFAPAFAGG